MLRSRRRGERELAFSNEHQVTNVDKRVWQIRENAYGIATENEVHAHQHAPGNAPVPKRYWNHTFTLSLRRDPLDKKPHGEKSVPNETENHEITPIETEKPVFLPDPRDSNECECVHSNAVFSVSRLPSQARGQDEGSIV